ncbi:porin [Variovorax sp. PCZ-1]|uniref:porin n=1 Tax=Variovorax sp. PCZ-1 TaxID=2835533 RepID=UPI001BCA9B67|nr:porin [Variovorax sp. PCZ-1]MBS7809112.1 porin [Variovorax sp. PCZ-1]
MKAKLSFLATACLLAGSALAQQSSATIYGLVDVGVTSVSGYKQGSVLAVNSGIMEGSRWGIRTTEDLGGGWRVMSTLESRAEVDTGSTGNRPPSGSQLPDRLTAGLLPAVAAGVTGAIGPTLGVNTGNVMFDRQAWVGLVTPIGGFLAGRQYSPGFEAFASFDIMQTQSAMSPAQLVAIPQGLDLRVNNSLQYRIVQGAWNAAAMIGFGETGSSSGNSRLMGINTIYKTDKFSVGFGHNTKNNSAGQRALSTTVFGASANFGSVSVAGMLANIKEPNASSGPELLAGLTAGGVPALVANSVIDRLKQDANLLHVGARYTMSNASHVTVALNRFNDKRASNADTTSYGVAYTYPFSKRTNVNFVLTKFNNSANAQAAPGGNGYLGGVTASGGTDSTSIAVGLRHSF